MRKPISTYCRQEVEGWNTLPPSMVVAPPGEEDFYCGFIRESDGVHLMASVKDYGKLQTIHVSLGPIRYYRPDLSDAEHEQLVFDATYDVVQCFFGERRFARQPDDPASRT
jgi:hypothetical protein